MGTCRESRPMERALDRFLQQVRSVDKILWSYSGKNIEKEEYPLSSFLWIEEELDEAHRLWMNLMEEKRNERDRVVKLNNLKHPPKISDDEEPDPFNGGIDKILEKSNIQSIVGMLTPKR